jgi:NADH:ubiquinone oxidoreductase subunit H
VRVVKLFLSKWFFFFFFIFCFIFLSQKYDVVANINLLFYTILPLFMALILVELNRAPFDFSERERELVRGFNLEFGRIFFIYIFLREYGFIIFFRIFISILCFNINLFIIFLSISFILFIRRVFPRYRYDLLIFLF